MSTNLQVALDEAGKVVKKQKICEQKVDEMLNQLIAVISKSRDEMLSENCMDQDLVVQDLQKSLENLGCMKECNSQTKELHSAIGKLGKALEKAFDTSSDICRAMKDVEMDKDALHLIIAEHLHREGRFELGDILCGEANLSGCERTRTAYMVMHRILSELREHNLAPALDWAVSHRLELSPDGTPSEFEFRLHSLAFLSALQNEGKFAALRYARAHFPSLSPRHLRGIQRHMAALLYSGRDPASLSSDLPYADLLRGGSWEEACQEYVRHACALMGQPSEPPLVSVVAAGTAALPHLIKLANVMEKGGSVMGVVAGDALPMEIELGSEFVYHSIFACPVFREQSSPANPPMLLPCNHVLCEVSVQRIARGRTRTFKCPYCPVEARPDNLRALIFPDALSFVPKPK